MIIRDATEEDIENIVPFTKRCFEEMQYENDGHTFDAKTAEETIRGCIENGIAVVAEKKGIIGFGMVFIVPSYMDKQNIMAVEGVWHSDPELNKISRIKIMVSLLKKIEERIKELGVKFFLINSSIHYPSIRRLLEKKGYRMRESNFIKEIG